MDSFSKEITSCTRRPVVYGNLFLEYIDFFGILYVSWRFGIHATDVTDVAFGLSAVPFGLLHQDGNLCFLEPSIGSVINTDSVIDALVATGSFVNANAGAIAI